MFPEPVSNTTSKSFTVFYEALMPLNELSTMPRSWGGLPMETVP